MENIFACAVYVSLCAWILNPFMFKVYQIILGHMYARIDDADATVVDAAASVVFNGKS